MKKERNKKGFKKPFKGPFPKNDNVEIERVRKSMRPHFEGPTVDSFSSNTGTTSVDLNGLSETKAEPNRPKRPSKSKKNKYPISFEWIIGIVFVLLSSFVGTVIYSHGNHFVKIDSEIENLSKNVDKNEVEIEKMKTNFNELDKDVNLLKYKLNRDSF